MLALVALFAAAPPGAAPNPARLARLLTATMPPVTKPVSFDTPEADAILEALAVFPPDNPWNLVVEDWPVHPQSKAIVASIGADKPLRHNSDMGFVLVPPDQPRVPFRVTGYHDEADKGPFPIPDGVPIEGWPINYPGAGSHKLTLDEVQRDAKNLSGDRHAIVVDPVNRKLYEFFDVKKTAAGWQGFSCAFDLASNRLRPRGWTSGDAAGLPIFPAVVRHDELKRGVIDHALRVTVRRSRSAFVYPATHFASRDGDPALPRMGERLRLRKDFDTSKFTPNARTVLDALKRHGMLVADNGIEWAVSVTPDPRIVPMHDELRKVKGADFEVVVAPPGSAPAR